ncbi:unnamed protein product [Peronospora destructor]|uniref:Temptin Cys/Cys disulfide domain-containing protein n=1 Tax=Peronospora destructor TaxID=86335 RepID=A0AAV0UKI7_9STRA|nr:unnamed protein product [Peronospora destructor]
MLRIEVAVLALGFMVAPSIIESYHSYVALIPNGGEVPDTPNLGHLDPAGETGLSGFGEAFSKASNVWSPALCEEDTDGDGYTNGQELGDACCTWTDSNPAGLVTDGLGNPSDASKIPTNSALLAGCSTGGGAESTSSGGMGDVVGKVAPAGSMAKPINGPNKGPSNGPKNGGFPPDDDDDDALESAVITADTAVTAISSVTMGLAMIVAFALACRRGNEGLFCKCFCKNESSYDVKVYSSQLKPHTWSAMVSVLSGTLETRDSKRMV